MTESKNSQRARTIEILKLIQELELRRKENPLKYAERHFKQSQFYKAQQPIRALFWGNRVGKTEIGAMEVARYMLGQHEYRDIPVPVEAWSVCPSFDAQAETTQKKLLHYLPEQEIADTTTIRKGIYSSIRLKNGSVVNFKSYEQGRSKFQGAGKRLIWFDEEPPHDIWEECVVRQEAGQPLDIILTMTPIKGMCFDDKTRILAKDGWVGIDELEVGDSIFTINKDSLELELREVDFIYRGVTNKPMVRMTCRGFDSLTTEDHRWFVKEKHSGKYLTRKTGELNKNHAIPRTFDNSYSPDTMYEDWYVALIGWIVTDGTYRKDRSQVIISQSVSKNRYKCKNIEQLLKDADADVRIDDVEYHKKDNAHGYARNYCIKGELAKRIISEFPNKELTGIFISRLNKRQQHILFDSLISGDGSKNSSGFRFVAEKKYRGTIDGFMMLCQLLGKRCTYSVEKDKYCRFYIQNSSRYRPFTHVSSLNIAREEYGGRVWCPHTSNETVIAMRNGTSYVSQNTWVYDEIYLSTDTSLYFVSTAGWDDNPWLTEEQKNIMSRGLTPEALAVRREGRFTKRVGLVCNWWDREKHLRDYTELPKSWTYYEVLDGGYSDPTAWLLIGVDHDDSVHVVDGFREPYLKTIDIKTRRDTKIGGVALRAGWCDDDNPRLQRELFVQGMRLEPVQKRVGDKASWDEALAEKLAEYGAIQKGTGLPRLFISNNLLRMDERSGREQNWMVQEIENLLWLEKVADGISEQKPRWDDHRKFGHHFDGLRALAYFLMAYKKPNVSANAVVTPIRDDPYQRSFTQRVDFEGGVL